ncbi:hypothetical protein AAII07_00175 [Microvirga sp. 0TCS3.31]
MPTLTRPAPPGWAGRAMSRGRPAWLARGRGVAGSRRTAAVPRHFDVRQTDS